MRNLLGAKGSFGRIGPLTITLLLLAALAGCQPVIPRATPLSQVEFGYAVVMADGTPYRAGPGSNREILGNLGRGDQVYVLARQGEWYQVRLADGQQVWMHSLVVQPLGDTATPAASATRSLPLALPSASPTTAAATPTGTLRPTRTPWPTAPLRTPTNSPTSKPPTATKALRPAATPTATAGTPTLTLRRIIVTGNLDALKVNWRFKWTSVGVDCLDANGQWLGRVNLLRADGWYPVPIATAQVKLWIGDELGSAAWWKRWDCQQVSAAPTEITLVIAKAQP